MSQTLPSALSIAGSDSSGGAGIQADLKTFTLFNVYGQTAITAITAQNTTGVHNVQVLAPSMVASQIDAVAQDIVPDATKTGMLANAELIRTVVERVQRWKLHPLVVDPVMIAKSGDALIDDDAVSALVQTLLPLAQIVTPNRHEAARLLGQAEVVRTLAQAESAAREIVTRHGCAACVVKAVPDGDEAVDVLFDGQSIHLFRGAHLTTGGTHGSGCAFSAAITAGLARGESMVQAVKQAKQFIQRAIHGAPARGRGTWPVDPVAGIKDDGNRR